MLKPVIVKCALVAALGLFPIGANAATYSFDFSTTDSVFTVTGTVTTAGTTDSVGGYDVLSILGTITGPGGGAITLDGNPSQPLSYDNAIWVYDNVLFPGAAPHIDDDGILFSSGAYGYNIYSTGPTTYYLSSNNPAGSFSPGELLTFGAGAVPEAPIWAMTLLGFAGLGFASYRRGRAAGFQR